jgi:uncharacterized protein (DUF433 family)
MGPEILNFESTGLMTLPDFLTQAPDGEIRLTGHRIGLYHLIERYNEGESAEMLACRYPSLPLSLVHKVLAYYLENQPEIGAYVRGCTTAMDQQRRGARSLDADGLRRRLQDRQLAPEAPTQ